MYTRESVATLYNRAADHVIGQPELNINMAEMVLRNPAVVSDRLTPQQFRGLSQSTINSVLDVVNVARIIAPATEIAPLQATPGETQEDMSYRIGIYGTLHRLQAHAYSADAESITPLLANQYRRAIWLASTAFEAILKDPRSQEYPVIDETLNYFAGNALAVVPHDPTDT